MSNIQNVRTKSVTITLDKERVIVTDFVLTF